MKGFVQELQKRRVYRVALAYVIVGSAAVQLAGTVLPTFHAPDWVQQVFVVFAALGFPVALVLAWAFEVRGGAIRRTRLSRGSRSTANRRRMWILAAAGFSVAAAAIFAYWWWHPWNSGLASRAALSGLRPEGSAATVPEKSIAVLPFENLSDDKQNSYFSDGVHDEILTDLAKVADLKVISRTSVMQYKTGTERNLRQIAKELGVAHIVEGTVQRSEGRVRVSAQLIDARTDTHVWAERYDRDLADVFAMQSELAERIVAQLKAHLSPEEKAAIEEQPTSNLAAYDLYIRAKALGATIAFTGRGKQNLFEAVRLLDEAIKYDPAFLLAYCQLARTHDQIYLLGLDHTPARLRSADTAIQIALGLRPNSGEAHLALAHHLYGGFLDYDRARAELALARRALPNEPLLYELAGYIDRRQGRWEESVRNMERASQLDPRNLFILQQISLSYQNLHRFAEMAAILDRALVLAPKDVGTRVARALVDLESRADSKPLHAAIEAILRETPDAAADISQAWLYLALCERDWNAAERALRAMPAGGCRTEGVAFPHGWCEGITARARGDLDAAAIAFRAARAEAERVVREQPAYAEAVCVLGLIDAGLGRKEEAIGEGQRAVQLLPVSKDAINGTVLLQYLAIIYAWTGENDRAFEQLAALRQLPGGLSYGQMRLDPYWDPIRGDPRFENLLAGLAP